MTAKKLNPLDAIDPSTIDDLAEENAALKNKLAGQNAAVWRGMRKAKNTALPDDPIRVTSLTLDPVRLKADLTAEPMLREVLVALFRLAPTKNKLARKTQRQELLLSLQNMMQVLIADDYHQQKGRDTNWQAMGCCLMGHNHSKMTPQDKITLTLGHTAYVIDHVSKPRETQLATIDFEWSAWEMPELADEIE